MSRVDTNQAKRDLMSVTIHKCQRQGWTIAQLATYMRVTQNTVRRWGHGRSMGTNAQRAELANLGTPAQERPRILLRAVGANKEADFAERMIAEDLARGADHVARYRQNRLVHLRARAVALLALYAELEDKNALP